MNWFKKAQETEEDMVGDIVGDVLRQEANPPAPAHQIDVRRSIDSSGYLRNNILKIKSWTYPGETLSQIAESAKACFDDASQITSKLKQSGFHAECTKDPGGAVIYSGFNAMYIKCVVVVQHDPSNYGPLAKLVRSLGVKT